MQKSKQLSTLSKPIFMTFSFFKKKKFWSFREDQNPLLRILLLLLRGKKERSNKDKMAWNHRSCMLLNHRHTQSKKKNINLRKLKKETSKLNFKAEFFFFSSRNFAHQKCTCNPISLVPDSFPITVNKEKTKLKNLTLNASSIQ